MNVSWTWHECVMDMFSSQWCDLRLVHHPVIAAVETTAVKVSSAGFEPADHRLGWLLQRLLHPDPGNRIITAGLSPEMELSPEVGRVRIPRAPGDVVLDPDLRIHLAESLKHLFRDFNNNLLKDFLLVESLTSLSSSISSSSSSSPLTWHSMATSVSGASSGFSVMSPSPVTSNFVWSSSELLALQNCKISWNSNYLILSIGQNNI